MPGVGHAIGSRRPFVEYKIFGTLALGKGLFIDLSILPKIEDFLLGLRKTMVSGYWLELSHCYKSPREWYLRKHSL